LTQNKRLDVDHVSRRFDALGLPWYLAVMCRALRLKITRIPRPFPVGLPLIKEQESAFFKRPLLYLFS